MRKTVRVDMDLRAYKKGDRTLENSVLFFHERLLGGWLGRCMESYFSQHVPALYDEDDTDHDYPTFRITPENWGKAMSVLSEEKELIGYLASYVTTPYSLHNVYDQKREYRDFGDIDITKAQRFYQWFAKEQQLSRIYPRRYKVVDFDSGRILMAVNDAFTLMLWFELDKIFRPYLQDDQYEAEMRIGLLEDFIREDFIMSKRTGKIVEIEGEQKWRERNEQKNLR